MAKCTIISLEIFLGSNSTLKKSQFDLRGGKEKIGRPFRYWKAFKKWSKWHDPWLYFKLFCACVQPPFSPYLVEAES